MPQVVLATGNQGKIDEMQRHLVEFGLEVVGQKSLNVPEADETGLTFVENAILKARNAACVTGLPAIADDSGICVDALNGAPGIYSARFSADLHPNAATDEKNNHKLIESLAGAPTEKRGAYYYCALVFVRHANDPCPVICEGKWEGEIIAQPRGQGGFGYDPHFYIAALDKTAAELSPVEKNKLSHRGKALHQLCQRLQNKL